MESSVVSDRFKELIGDNVRAALFTTFTFEVNFFELEVIPLLLPGDTAFSSDSRVKIFQAREVLRDAQLPIEVFYDLPMFRRDGQVSPSMEYLCHGVQVQNAAFHPKLSLILAYSEEYESEYLLVGAGSNNLSQAGWWDNIECLHWEEVWPNEVEHGFLRQLRKDVKLLSEWQQLPHNSPVTALSKVMRFLDSCKGSQNDKAAAYFGLSASPRFKSFLRNLSRKKWTYKNLTLEIISPFFANDAQNTEHDFFYKLGVNKIHLLLPIDQDGKALCQQSYFNHIESQESIEWAEWAPSIRKELGLEAQNYRRLHAKIYHFYNKKQSWVFIGSVNFTHKAMHDNIEAGFFVKLDHPLPLLKAINGPEPDGFNPPSDIVPGKFENDDDQNLPEIHLSYDWLKQELSANTSSGSYRINIVTPEDKSAISKWLVTPDTDNKYKGNVKRLETLLQNGSLVKVTGVKVTEECSEPDQPFSAHIVMLQQLGWTHKPIDMPDLSAEQILAIYADMSPDRRQLLMMNAMFKKLVLGNVAGEITLFDEDVVSEQFFSEYAEIFHAFRRLKHRLQEALSSKNKSLVDYYLTGQGMDSLPVLIQRASEVGDDSVKPVTAYLLLLSAREVYQNESFKKRPLIKEKLTALKKEIRKLKASQRIQLEDNSPDRRKTFFAWFEKQFFKKYRSSEVAE